MKAILDLNLKISLGYTFYKLQPWDALQINQEKTHSLSIVKQILINSKLKISPITATDHQSKIGLHLLKKSRRKNLKNTMK